jgi:hypothetical protein
MTESKMVDADGHIREIESDVFEYLPDYYKNRRDAVLYFPLLPHHGWHRQAGTGGMGASFLIPTLKGLAKGTGPRQHRGGGGLSDALHAHRPGGHG